MRFIVELYRVLVIGMLALAIIAASYIFFRVIQAPEMATGTGIYVLIACFTVAVFVILSMGITATFISIHDRLEDIANSAQTLAKLNEEGSSHPLRTRETQVEK